LTYKLPFVPQTENVQLCEHQTQEGCGNDSDVIRFGSVNTVNGTIGRLRFYSLNTASEPLETGNLADQYASYPSNLNIQNENQLSVT
jgi:hypothetical protein